MSASLRLEISVAPSELTLSSDEEDAIAQRILSEREYLCWYGFHRENRTYWGISKFYHIPHRTVARMLKRANIAMTNEIAEVQEALRSEKLRIGVTVHSGSSSHFSKDKTLERIVRAYAHLDLWEHQVDVRLAA